MKKRYFAIGFAVCVITAICVYSAHPKYAFALENCQFTRGNYVFKIYGSRTMVVSYGYKKSREISPEMPAEEADRLDYLRKAKRSNEITVKIGIKQLSKQQYDEFAELFAAAEKKNAEYLRTYRVPYYLTGDCDFYDAPVWEAVFPKKDGIANAYFVWGTVMDGEPMYAQIAQKAADISPIPVTDMVGNSVRIASYDDADFKAYAFSDHSNWRFSDRVMMRVWSDYLYKKGVKVEIHDFLDYLFWEKFPPSKKKCKYKL